jgi:hypothetical protein
MSGVKLKRVTTFPRQVIGGAGIDVKKQNGNFAISLDYAEFGLHSPYVPAPDHRVVIFAQGTSGYFTVPTSVLSGLGDPHWSNVVLLMGFEGANGSTGTPGMDDESPAAHGTASILLGSGPTISNTYAKFGSTSLSLVNQRVVTFADSADWAFGSGNYTVECFIKPTAIAGANMFLCCQWINVPNQSWAMYLLATTGKLSMITSADGSATAYNISGTTNIVANSTHHCAVDFDGTKTRVYLDGVMEASTSTLVTIHDSNQILAIGNASGSNIGAYTGFIDELRITKGVARYASDSGYTVPTAAFPRHG